MSVFHTPLWLKWSLNVYKGVNTLGDVAFSHTHNINSLLQRQPLCFLWWCIQKWLVSLCSEWRAPRSVLDETPPWSSCLLSRMQRKQDKKRKDVKSVSCQIVALRAERWNCSFVNSHHSTFSTRNRNLCGFCRGECRRNWDFKQSLEFARCSTFFTPATCRAPGPLGPVGLSCDRSVNSLKIWRGRQRFHITVGQLKCRN